MSLLFFHSGILFEKLPSTFRVECCIFLMLCGDGMVFRYSINVFDYLFHTEFRIDHLSKQNYELL